MSEEDTPEERWSSPSEARTMAGALPMAVKVVLVTGGTGGIGKATAIGLASIGARVGITGRDLGRAEQVAAAIRSASGNHAVDAFGADMSSQTEVRRLAVAILDTYPRLDVLVNNVGGFWAHRHLTADGLEQTFAVNHLAAFLLTNLLMDRLKASAPARVVTVSSGAQSMGRIDFDDLEGARNYSGQRAYSQSKLASIMFTFELARRLEGTGVTATAVHPGVVRTNFGAEDQAWFFTVVSGLVRPFLKTPAQGAQTSIFLASSPDIDGATGKFLANRRPKTANKFANDAQMSARLWQVSANLVGFDQARVASA